MEKEEKEEKEETEEEEKEEKEEADREQAEQWSLPRELTPKGSAGTPRPATPKHSPPHVSAGTT